MLTIGSLCAGALDGMGLGLEWAGLGPVLWQVEIDAKRRANLARHWPRAERYADVRAVDSRELNQVDIITSTFPCTDVSAAGPGAGLAGARSGVWFDCLRIISELRPPWVIVENVASGAKRWVDPVRSGLERHGYSTLPVPLAASDCGAPHRRARVFILAYAQSERREQGRLEQQATGTHQRSSTGRDDWWASEPDVGRVVHGLPKRVGPAGADAVAWLGDSVVPQCAEVIGWVVRELAGLTGEE